MNLASILTSQASERPDQLAFISSHLGQERSLTYREIDRATNRFANWLIDQGYQKGDAALLLSPMSPELYIALLGLWKAGLCVTLPDLSAGKPVIDACVARMKPKLFLGSLKALCLSLIYPALRKIPMRLNLSHPHLWFPGIRSFRRILDSNLSETFQALELSPEHPALVTFTSGTTHVPKAACRTHQFLFLQNEILSRSLHLQPGEVDLATLPVFALSNLANGLTTLIPEGDLSRPASVQPARVALQILKYRPQRCAASPAFLQQLLHQCQKQTPDLFQSFQWIHTGGAPVFPKLLKDLTAAAPHAKIELVYGSTEAEPITHVSAHEVITHSNPEQGIFCGKPISEIQLRLLKIDSELPHHPTEDLFESLSKTHGQAGEILVSGPHVLSGYLDGIGNMENKIDVNGTIWHRTGDAGILTEKGLFFLGRVKSRTEWKAHSLFPLQVETLARDHAEIKTAALYQHSGQHPPFILIQFHPETTPNNQKNILSALEKKIQTHHASELKIIAVPYIPVDRRHQAKIDLGRLRKWATRHFKSLSP